MDDPLRGIALIVASTMALSTSDAMAKYITQTVPVVEISFFRYVVFVVFAAWLVQRSAVRRFRVRSPTQQAARGVMTIGSALLFMLAIRHLPLADAAAIGFVSPLMITLLSVPVLGEVVGLRRWLALFAGLVGVFAVVRPGTTAFQPAALLSVASATCWAVASLLTRRMAHTDPAATTLFWSATTGLAILIVLLPFSYVTPTMGQVGFCIILGIVSSVGQYLMVLAYRHAAASVLAPFSYSQLLWATTFGYFIFAAFPDRWTLAGAVLIVAAGIYSARAERRAMAARVLLRR